MPVACFCKSMRVASIFRIASSSRIRGVSDGAAHIALANGKMKKTNRYIGLNIYGGGRVLLCDADVLWLGEKTEGFLAAFAVVLPCSSQYSYSAHCVDLQLQISRIKP